MELKNYIKIYDNALPLEAIASLVRIAGTFNFEQATVSHENVVEKNIRSAKVKFLSNLSDSMTETHWHNFLYSIMKDYIMKYNKEFNIIDYSIVTKILNIDLIKYEKFDKYNYHWDHFITIPRTLSCTLILNDDYEGGNLCFREPQGGNEFCIKNKSGRLIMWPSNFLYPHCVKPITKGTRYAIVSWAL